MNKKSKSRFDFFKDTVQMTIAKEKKTSND
jgi:hypothetical protein